MEIVIIKEESQEWDYMLEWLGNHPLNEGLSDPKIALNPLNDCQWKYAGSFREDQKIIHEFIHSSHPKDNERQKLSLWASDKITGGDIDKVISIK